MPLKVTCFYCGARKIIESGRVVKLTCDLCSSPQVVLEKTATFRCALCHRVFTLPGGQQVMSFHDEEDCRGRSLILIDY
ncbi:MAG: hypothetical protein V1742_00975 [Pseudomonadota bacterium]